MVAFECWGAALAQAPSRAPRRLPGRVLSPSRRSANSITAADEGSSHWRSSIAQTTSDSPARARRQREKPGSDDTRLGRPRRSGAQERGVEPHPLRFGKSREELVGHVGEEIREPCEGEPRFGLGRPRYQYPGALPASTLDRRLPQRRLTDPRLAHDRQSAGPFGGQECSAAPNSDSRPTRLDTIGGYALAGPNTVPLDAKPRSARDFVRGEDNYRGEAGNVDAVVCRQCQQHLGLDGLRRGRAVRGRVLPDHRGDLVLRQQPQDQQPLGRPVRRAELGLGAVGSR